MRMKFMNTEIDNLTIQEALERIDELIQENKCAYVCHPNVDTIVNLEYLKGEQLTEAYEQADLILTDGKPLVWISKLYGTPIKERISGPDIFPYICKLAAQKGYSIFLMGGPEGVAEKAAENLQKTYSGIKIAGTYSPPYGFEKDEAELQKIVKIVHDAKPHILVVAIGCPKQELFMYHHCKDLCVPISLGVGAVINFTAGTVKRAPAWMSKHGLEWLYRATQERRLIKRYAIDFLRLPGLILKYWPESPPPQSVVLLNFTIYAPLQHSRKCFDCEGLFLSPQISLHKEAA